MSLKHIFFGVLAAFLWLLFFTLGLLVPTSGSLAALDLETFTISEFALRMLIIVTCWTITNIGFLTCYAAYVGEFARFIRVTEKERNSPTTTIQVSFGRAVVRGFLIYLLVIGGLILTTTDSMLQPAQDTYFRLAGIMSLTGFVTGYYPDMFARFMSRVVVSLESEA